MTIPLHLWGAGLAVALGGAFAGNALGSAPILDRSTLIAYYQAHTDTGAGEPGRELPDHYPLVTREGVVPVAALSERGLYSQARYRAFAYAYTGDPGPAPQLAQWSDESDFAPEPAPAEPVEEANDGEPPIEPLRLAVGPTEVASAGEGKLVDVQLSLAMQ